MVHTRLTSQTPKLSLVGVATDRGASHACLRFFSFSCFFFLLAFLFFFFFFFFFIVSTKNQKMPPRGTSPRRLETAHFVNKKNVTRNFAATEARKKLGPQRSHSVLQASCLCAWTSVRRLLDRECAVKLEKWCREGESKLNHLEVGGVLSVHLIEEGGQKRSVSVFVRLRGPRTVWRLRLPTVVRGSTHQPPL